MKLAVLILGSGKGERLGMDVPKPLLRFKGKDSKPRALDNGLLLGNLVYMLRGRGHLLDESDIFVTCRDENIRDFIDTYTGTIGRPPSVTFIKPNNPKHVHTAKNDLIMGLSHIAINAKSREYDGVLVVSGDSYISEYDMRKLLAQYAVETCFERDEVFVCGSKHGVDPKKLKQSGVFVRSLGQVKKFLEKCEDFREHITSKQDQLLLSCSIYIFTPQIMNKLIVARGYGDQLGSYIFDSLFGDIVIGKIPWYKCSTIEIPSWFDVNTPEELERLRGMIL